MIFKLFFRNSNYISVWAGEDQVLCPECLACPAWCLNKCSFQVFWYGSSNLLILYSCINDIDLTTNKLYQRHWFSNKQVDQRHWFNNKQDVIILKITLSALKIFLFSSKLSETKIKTHNLKLSHIWEIFKLFLSTLTFQLFLFLILTFGFIWRTSRRINAASATSLSICGQHRRWVLPIDLNIILGDFLFSFRRFSMDWSSTFSRWKYESIWLEQFK